MATDVDSAEKNRMGANMIGSGKNRTEEGLNRRLDYGRRG